MPILPEWQSIKEILQSQPHEHKNINVEITKIKNNGELFLQMIKQIAIMLWLLCICPFFSFLRVILSLFFHLSYLFLSIYLSQLLYFSLFLSLTLFLPFFPLLYHYPLWGREWQQIIKKR